MATVADYFGSALSCFPTFGARAIDACRERAAAEIVDSGSDDIDKPLRGRCDSILSGWGISEESKATASDDAVSMLGNADSVNTGALVATLIASLMMIGYKKFMDNSGTDSPFVCLGER